MKRYDLRCHLCTATFYVTEEKPRGPWVMFEDVEELGKERDHWRKMFGEACDSAEESLLLLDVAKVTLAQLVEAMKQALQDADKNCAADSAFYLRAAIKKAGVK